MNNSERILPDRQGHKDGKFKTLLTRAIYGFFLSDSENVLATHRELLIMRQCSDFLKDRPERIIHVLTAGKRTKNRFIENTLLHLGVSCGKILIDSELPELDAANGVWLLVEEQNSH